MISEKRIKEFMIQALQNVKNSEAAYQSLSLNDDTILLGSQSPLDSIAFTAFATDFEEKMEDATGEPYVLNLEEIYSSHGRRSIIKVKDLAGIVCKMLEGSHKS